MNSWLAPLSGLAARSGANIHEIDALFVAQLAGRHDEVSERDLGDELRLERIAHVESGANSLAGVRRIGQFVLLVGDVEQSIFRIGPQAVRFPSMAEKCAYDFAAAGCG